MATQFTTWMFDSGDWLDFSDEAWATWGLRWDDSLGAPVRPRTLQFYAKRPFVQLYVRLKKKESGIDE